MSLKLVNIKKSYPDFEIDLSFDIEKGKLITLLGPSGCGKTTTLHIIAGFIVPDRGKIIVERKRVDRLPPHLRKTGIVFQDYALFPNMNVFNNIAFGLRMQGWSKKRVERRVHELLELIRLYEYGKRAVTNLSGGEQQRVALARALAPNPNILLLDEPLSALDAKLRKELRSDIKRIQQRLHLTTVYVTHDQEEAFAISDKIAVMHDGKIEQIGKSHDIYNRPETFFVANFVGLTNTIDAQVARSNGNRTEVESAFGKFTVQFHKKLETDSRIVLIFRPEKCKLTVDSHKRNTIRGIIINCEYLGDSTILTLKSKNTQFTVKIADTATCVIGDTVNITFSPEDCWLLEDQLQ